jgi:hypothetical protein
MLRFYVTLLRQLRWMSVFYVHTIPHMVVETPSWRVRYFCHPSFTSVLEGDTFLRTVITHHIELHIIQVCLWKLVLESWSEYLATDRLLSTIVGDVSSLGFHSGRKLKGIMFTSDRAWTFAIEVIAATEYIDLFVNSY